ncbi:4135_t:CDS:2, partial [Gigaspora margarita]
VQNVLVPYSPQQISTTYFKSALQAHIFGKGANSTINLVYNGLQQFHNCEKHLKVTCDNCSAQITGHTKFICNGYF